VTASSRRAVPDSRRRGGHARLRMVRSGEGFLSRHGGKAAFQLPALLDCPHVLGRNRAGDEHRSVSSRSCRRHHLRTFFGQRAYGTVLHWASASPSPGPSPSQSPGLSPNRSLQLQALQQANPVGAAISKSPVRVAYGTMFASACACCETGTTCSATCREGSRACDCWAARRQSRRRGPSILSVRRETGKRLCSESLLW
jgi:hypothetical protein